MASEKEFGVAYQRLVALTNGFTDIDHEKLRAALETEPSTLAPLRMILGFTYSELAWAMKLTQPGTTTRGDTLKRFERNPSPQRANPREAAMIDTLVTTVLAIMGGKVLQIPPAARTFFHSKLDKRDTRDGWDTVAEDAGGVPYSALLYQRYVGGVWRQVQDAYSEVKGDRLLEMPLANLLDSNGISYYRSGSGATGAARTAERFGLSPGPDFALPEQSPTVIIESKVGEDGGPFETRPPASRTWPIWPRRAAYWPALLSTAEAGRNEFTPLRMWLSPLRAGPTHSRPLSTFSRFRRFRGFEPPETLSRFVQPALPCRPHPPRPQSTEENTRDSFAPATRC